MIDLLRRDEGLGFLPAEARGLLAVVVLVHWLAQGLMPLPFSPDGSPGAPLAEADRTSHAIASRSATPVIVKQAARTADFKSGGDRPLDGLAKAEATAPSLGRPALVIANLAGDRSSGGQSPYRARAPPKA
jgi:hypothetical protein